MSSVPPTLVIPLPGSRPSAVVPSNAAVSIWMPVPLTAEQWDHFLHVLDAMRPGLVRQEGTPS